MDLGENKKLINTLVIVAVIIGYGGWAFVIKPSMAKKQAWSGTVTDKIKDRTRVRRNSVTRRYRYDYYLQVKCEDGEIREVEVLNSMFNRAKIGDPIRKEKGERWPILDTPEAEKARKNRAKTMDKLKETLPF